MEAAFMSFSLAVVLVLLTLNTDKVGVLLKAV